jgi:hypothetical protein
MDANNCNTVSQELAVIGCGCLEHDTRAESSSKISAAQRMVHAGPYIFQFLTMPV